MRHLAGSLLHSSLQNIKFKIYVHVPGTCSTIMYRSAVQSMLCNNFKLTRASLNYGKLINLFSRKLAKPSQWVGILREKSRDLTRSEGNPSRALSKTKEAVWSVCCEANDEGAGATSHRNRVNVPRRSSLNCVNVNRLLLELSPFFCHLVDVVAYNAEKYFAAIFLYSYTLRV